MTWLLTPSPHPILMENPNSRFPDCVPQSTGSWVQGHGPGPSCWVLGLLSPMEGLGLCDLTTCRGSLMQLIWGQAFGIHCRLGIQPFS